MMSTRQELKQKKKEIEDKKNKIFDEYNNKKPNWKEEIAEKIWEEIENIKEPYSTCVAPRYQKLEKLKTKYGTDKNKFLSESESELKNILWDNRELTEEIAPEIIEDFDCVTAKEGTIHIVVSLPLGPFFKGGYEERFQKLRLTNKWERYIDFDKLGKGTLCKNGIFTYDEKEREIEKVCYDIKAFRGFTYNELLTPIYKLDRENKKDQITKLFDKIENNDVPEAFENEKKEEEEKEKEKEKRKLSKELSGSELEEAVKTLESKEVFIKKVFGKTRNTLLEEEKWDIKLRLTKGGLVNIYFEKNLVADFCKKEFKEPYSIEGLWNEIKPHQYGIGLQTPYNSIDWLNELLKVPDFYGKLKSKINTIKLSDHIIHLVKKTNEYRDKNFSELSNDEKSNIKKLNRLLLEETYPDKTPKSHYNIEKFAEEKRDLMRDPYSNDELKEQKLTKEDIKRISEIKLLKEEQVFTSYLNAAAIWIIHIFLKEILQELQEPKGCKVDEKKEKREIAKILGIKKGKKVTDYVECPWEVMHETEVSNTKDTIKHKIPPLRNYCVTFLLKDVEGMAWGFNKPLSTRVHFDCPADITTCEKRKECFIKFLGHSLLALSTNTYVYKDKDLKRPWFTQKELENFAKKDLSRWRGELCFIDSETIVICTPPDIEDIDKEGSKVTYDNYWKYIIKSFSLLVSCKTLAMDISRNLFECIRQHRDKLTTFRTSFTKFMVTTSFSKNAAKV